MSEPPSMADPDRMAVARAAAVVDLPGAPLSLRLESADIDDNEMRLAWSFVDPESFDGDPWPQGRRILGELRVELTDGVTDEVARAWWARAQLAAAYRYRQQVDGDWIPGEPFTPEVWTTDEAWRALLSYLGSEGEQVHVERGGIRVGDGTDETRYQIDPDSWALYLNGPDTARPPADTPIVRAASPKVHGLPLWAVDELTETAGAFGPVVGLVAGRLVGIKTDEGSDGAA